MEELSEADLEHDIGALLGPTSIAIVGATDSSYFSQRLTENLLASSPGVPVHLVSRNRETVHGQPAVPSLDVIPGGVDQVIALVSEAGLGGVLDDAHRLGARSAVVVASQKAGDLHSADDDPIQPGRRPGLVILGSGSLGYIGDGGTINALASHFKRSPLPGSIAVISQSGGLAVTASRLLDDLGSGLSFLASVGAEREVDATEFFRYATEDPVSEAVLLILEGVRRPAAFRSVLESARRRGKPVVILKLGQSERGRQMAVTHTGSLAGSAEAFAAVCNKHDAMLARDLDEAVDAVSVLQRLSGREVSTGSGVMVVTASGAAGIAAADAADRRGVELPEFSHQAKAELKALLPDFAHVANPLDVTAQIRSDSSVFEHTTRVLARESGGGALAFVFALGLPDHDSPSHQASFEEISRLAANSSKPLLAASISRTPIPDWGREFLTRTALPFARSYEAAFSALQTWFRLVKPLPDQPDRHEPRTVALGRGTLDEIASKSALARYGVSGPVEMVVVSSEEATDAARSIGYPVALKLVAASMPHKAGAGAVKLGIPDDGALADAVGQIETVSKATLSDERPTMLVSAMVEPVHEVLVGAYHDDQFGPMVVCGHGGGKVESLSLKPAVAPAPVSRFEASRLIAASGVGRATEGGDLNALSAAIVGVSRLIADHADRIVSIDVNPIAVLPDGAGVLALDALIQGRED